MATTVLSNLINPQVMADMIEAKLDKRLAVIPFAKIDNTLQGQPGDTITVPKYGYIGSAEDIAEGGAITPTAMSTSSTTATVKQVGKGVELTDVAVLSGYGDPVGNATSQIAMSIDEKVDNDCFDEALTGTLTYDGTSAKISYNAVVSAIDVLEEEVNSAKVLYVHPKQVTDLRKDANFISADKYGVGTNVMMFGEIGMICNARVVASKKCPLIKYTLGKSSDSGALAVIASGSPTSSQVLAATVKGCTWDATNKKVVSPAASAYVVAVTANYYINPILKLTNDMETEDDIPAITIYNKRGVMIETQRPYMATKTGISATKHYVAKLTNDAKVVVASIKA